MNKNATALILIILAIGIYFTFTRGKMSEIKAIREVNVGYEEAIANAKKLMAVRDNVLQAYNSISETDRDRLNKLVPDNVDNVRLIIDVKDDIAAQHGLALKNIKTASPETATGGEGAPVAAGEKYGTVTLAFVVSSGYEQFLNFLKDLEASLRIMDISRLSIAPNDQGNFDFTVEIKTYWLKQK